MDDQIFYEYEDGRFGDGITLDFYRGEYALVSAKKGQDDKIYMQWCYPQKSGGKGPLEKSLPWKIKLGEKTEAIKVLKFFLSHLEENSSSLNDMPLDKGNEDDAPF